MPASTASTPPWPPSPTRGMLLYAFAGYRRRRLVLETRRWHARREGLWIVSPLLGRAEITEKRHLLHCGEIGVAGNPVVGAFHFRVGIVNGALQGGHHPGYGLWRHVRERRVHACRVV